MIAVSLRPPPPSGTGEEDPPRQDRLAGSGEFDSLLAELDARNSGVREVSPRAARQARAGEESRGDIAGPEKPAHDADATVPARSPAVRRASLLDAARNLLHDRPPLDAGIARERPEPAAMDGAADPELPPPSDGPAETSADAPVRSPLPFTAMFPAEPLRQPSPTASAPGEAHDDGPGRDEAVEPALTRAPEESPPPAPGARIVLRETHFAPVLAAESRPPDRAKDRPAELRSADARVAVARPMEPEQTPPAPSDAPPAATISGQPSPGREDGREVPSHRAPARTTETRDEMPTPSRPSAGPAIEPAAPAEAVAAPSPVAVPSPAAVALPSSPPALQVATAIAEAVRVGAPAAPEAGASRGPVRVLEIQLHPVELGLVTVRLRTGRNGLEIQVNAARAETARLIEQDRALLLASLAGPEDVPPELSIGRHGLTSGLTGYDAPREPNVTPAAPEEREADSPGSDSRRRRQPHENPSDSAADGDASR